MVLATRTLTLLLLYSVVQTNRYTVKLSEHKNKDMAKDDITIMKAAQLKCSSLNVTFKPCRVILGEYEPDLPQPSNNF